MRNKLSIFMVIALIAFLSVCTKVAADTEKIDAKIKRAIDSWRDPKSFDSCQTGFTLLVDAIVMAAPETEFPAELGEKISKAKKLFNSSSVFNEKGIALLNESYILVTSGKEFQMPDSITSIKRAEEYALEQLDAAREYLKQGKVDECVKILLEIAVMIVTPVIKGSKFS
jgi:hypothetical protein